MTVRRCFVMTAVCCGLVLSIASVSFTQESKIAPAPKESPCQSCAGADVTTPSVFSPNLGWRLEIRPLRPGLSIVVLTVNTRNPNVTFTRSRIGSNALVHDGANGLVTITLYHEGNDWPNVEGIAVTRGMGAINGSGGVWDGWPTPKCHSRSCYYACRDCEAGKNDCKEKFDAVCGAIITCATECDDRAPQPQPTPAK